jgi:hypothetical protein
MKNSKVNSSIPASVKETARAEAEEKTSETVIQKIFDELPVP